MKKKFIVGSVYPTLSTLEMQFYRVRRRAEILQCSLSQMIRNCNCPRRTSELASCCLLMCRTCDHPYLIRHKTLPPGQRAKSREAATTSRLQQELKEFEKVLGGTLRIAAAVLAASRRDPSVIASIRHGINLKKWYDTLSALALDLDRHLARAKSW